MATITMSGTGFDNSAVTSCPLSIPLPTLQVPEKIGWTYKPAAMGCPPGLEYLSQLDKILVHQQIELVEVLTSWEGANRYQVKNSLGQQIFFAYEESDVLMRQLLGPRRGFKMHVVDNNQQEVMTVVREQFAIAVTVESPPGQTIGYVRQSGCCVPSLELVDENDQLLLNLRGQTCLGPCCTRDIEFKLMSAGDTVKVGKIIKRWAGYLQETYTNADNFEISFPIDLEVKTKAIVLGALFLLDFGNFENNNRR